MTDQPVTSEAVDAPVVSEPVSSVSQDASAAPVVQSDTDWKAEAEKWKALSRKHENANSQAMKELESIRTAQMTDSEKALAEAEKRGREAMMKELGAQIAEAKIRAAATGKVADVDALIELVDVSKFVTADGVDDTAIAATIDRFSKVAPAQPAAPKFGAVELGPQGDRPRQLGESDLARMTPEQIVEARKMGQFDDVLGVTS